MGNGLFDEYTPQGKRIIEMGLFFVLLWSIAYILMSVLRIVTLKSVSLWMTVPFLLFGTMCVLTGLYMRKNAKRRSLLRSHDHLVIGLLLLESVAALLVLYYAISHAMIDPWFVISDVTAVILSGVSLYLYLGLHNGREIIAKAYTSSISIAAIASHFAWAYFLKLLV